MRRWVRELLAPAALALVLVAATPALVRLTSIEGWVAISLAAVVAYLFVDHAAHAFADYTRRGGVRRLRGLMLALLLGAGALAILMGNLARYVPEVADVSRFLRWVSVGMLFVGGITTWITWRIDHSEEE